MAHLRRIECTLHEYVRMFIYNISLNFSWNEKCFVESCRENQNAHFVFGYFPLKIMPCVG